MPTIYASYSDPAAAEHAAGALLDHGASAEQISILVGEASGYARSINTEQAAEKGISTTTPADASAGAIKGGVAGAGIGALAILASLFVPGVGLVLGGGALAMAFAGGAGTIAAGVAAGGVVGYLKDQGVTTDLAATYSDDLGRGGAILGVTVPTGNLTAEDAEAMLVKYGAITVSTLNKEQAINSTSVPPTENTDSPTVRDPSGTTFVQDPVVVAQRTSPDVWADPVTTATIVEERSAVGNDLIETANVPISTGIIEEDVLTEPLVTRSPLPSAYTDKPISDPLE